MKTDLLFNKMKRSYFIKPTRQCFMHCLVGLYQNCRRTVLFYGNFPIQLPILPVQILLHGQSVYPLHCNNRFLSFHWLKVTHHCRYSFGGVFAIDMDTWLKRIWMTGISGSPYMNAAEAWVLRAIMLQKRRFLKTGV